MWSSAANGCTVIDFAMRASRASCAPSRQTWARTGAVVRRTSSVSQRPPDCRSVSDRIIHHGVVDYRPHRGGLSATWTVVTIYGAELSDLRRRSPGFGVLVSGLLVGLIGAGSLAAMGDTVDVNHQARVDDLVEDPVVADAYPVHGLLPCQSDTAGWPRLISQQIDRGANPLLLGVRQPGDRPDRPAGDLDGVAAHSSPSAALTSSQGT